MRSRSRSRTRSRSRSRTRSRSRERRQIRTNTTRRRGRSLTRRRSVSPAPFRYAHNSSRDFAYDHIFLLAGHGKDTSLAPEDRYRLQPDEFYLTSVTCGHTSYIVGTFWYHFLQSHPQIRIPISYSDTYISINSITTSRLRTRTSLNERVAPTESAKFKFYVPFSEKAYTHSIPASRVSLLSEWPIKDCVIPSEFVFNGHTYTTATDKFNVYKIGISGILTPGHRTIKIRSALQTLRHQSDAIAETFKIPAYHNTSTVLFACLPESSNDILIKADTRDPLTAHFKDVITAVYEDSIIKPTTINPEITYKMLWDYHKLEDLYRLVKSTLRSPGPVLIINNLCRSYVGPVENITDYNSNTEASPRGTLRAPLAAANTRGVA